MRNRRRKYLVGHGLPNVATNWPYPMKLIDELFKGVPETKSAKWFARTPFVSTGLGDWQNCPYARSVEALRC
jgi:hypothetical protein